MIKKDIQQLIKDYPRSWVYKFKKNPEMMSAISTLMLEYNLSIQASVYCLLNDVNPICKYGNTKKFTWFAKGFSYCGIRSKCRCNNESSIEKVKKTNLNKYGNEVYTRTDEYKRKAKQTCIEKFGVEYASYSPSIREKAKQTCIEKYGVEFPAVLPEIHQLAKETKKLRYNDANFNNIKKRNKTLLNKYGVTNASYINMDSDSLQILSSEVLFKEFIKGKTLPEAAYLLKIDKNTINKYANKYDSFELFDSSRISKLERMVANLLDKYSVQYIQNTKKYIAPYELDFYLPEYNIAIELNGNYWHSEIGGNKDKNYHYDKWKMCREKGIDLYSWFEDELINNSDIVESKIRYITKQPIAVIGARKCKILSVTAQDASRLLDENHIQGTINGQRLLGAYHNDILVAILSWSMRSKYLEITRFATNTKASYPGLFSKMMKYMINELDYSGQIVSFSNNGHSNGNLYKSSGFQIDKILGPAYWYTKDYVTRENRQRYMKQKIAKKFNIDMTDKTEWQAMQELGYDRIWDSGKIKWILTIGEYNG